MLPLGKDNINKLKAYNIELIQDLIVAPDGIEGFKRLMTLGKFNDEISDKLLVSVQPIAQEPNSDILTGLTKLVEEKLVR